jgi:hypothetical protein
LSSVELKPWHGEIFSQVILRRPYYKVLKNTAFPEAGNQRYLFLQALAQVGGIVLLSPEVGGSKENFFFAGVDNVRWRKPVVPGDTLLLRVTLTKLQKKFGIAKLEGKAYVDGQLVCEADLMLMIGK